MDSGSSVTTVKNKEFVHDIKAMDTPLKLNANAGTTKIKEKATLPGFGEVPFKHDLMANILALADATDKWRVTMDTDIEDAILVHTDKGVVKFKRTPDRLCAYQPSDSYKKQIKQLQVNDEKRERNEISNLVDTVAENRKGYTAREFARAKVARKLYHAFSCHSVPALKNLIRSRLMRNCSVTTEDVDIAERIFGKDVGTLKGKTTRPKPPIVRTDVVEIPKEILTRWELELSVDVMWVNSKPYLTGIDKPIKLRSANKLLSQTKDALFMGLDLILRPYNQAGFKITVINCDNQFRKLLLPLQDDLDLKVNVTSRGEHVPEAERNHRTIEERCRATYHNLPYKLLPQLMADELVTDCVFKLNLFPAKGGVSSYYGPWTIITKKDVDYEKYLTIPFGTYVQAYQENNPTNTNAARTVDAMCLGPEFENNQGGHKCMDLNTGRLIRPMKVCPQPVTQFVINAVEEMARKQKMKSFKITGKNKQPLHPADWIAGVDYENENDYVSDDDEDFEDEFDPEDEHSHNDTLHNDGECGFHRSG